MSEIVGGAQTPLDLQCASSLVICMIPSLHTINSKKSILIYLDKLEDLSNIQGRLIIDA